MTHAGPAIAIGVIDVGSPTKDKLGWAILGPDEVPRLGKDLDDFITEMADFRNPPTRAGDALFFEAFVTGLAKGSDHADDALIAAREMQRLLGGDAAYRSAIDEAEVFSLLGAALLRTGWSNDLGLLSSPCLVVRPGFDPSWFRRLLAAPLDGRAATTLQGSRGLHADYSAMRAQIPAGSAKSAAATPPPPISRGGAIELISAVRR